MKKILTTHLFVLVAFITANAQHKTYFEPKLSNNKTDNSLYNSIKLIDSRPDTSLGFVQTGAFNRRAAVVTKHSFANEISTVFNSLIGKDPANGELVLHLRQLSFAELTAGMSETGYCAFQAGLYAQNQDKYELIGSVDTVFQLRSSVDVTNALLRKGSDTLSGFIQTCLSKKPVSGRPYSYKEIEHIDSVEKLGIKLYTTTTYTDGLYLTYQSFKNQLPDKAVTVINTYLYPGNVKALDEKGKLKDVKMNKSYAVVHNGQPYIVTPYGFYPLTKVNNDFTFTGQAKVSASTGTMIASSMFGLFGALVASSGNDATFLMKIDHQKGSFIRLKEIAEIKAKTISKGDSWD